MKTLKIDWNKLDYYIDLLLGLYIMGCVISFITLIVVSMNKWMSPNPYSAVMGWSLWFIIPLIWLSPTIIGLIILLLQDIVKHSKIIISCFSIVDVVEVELEKDKCWKDAVEEVENG